MFLKHQIHILQLFLNGLVNLIAAEHTTLPSQGDLFFFCEVCVRRKRECVANHRGNASPAPVCATVCVSVCMYVFGSKCNTKTLHCR